jgi:hypothetical protein
MSGLIKSANEPRVWFSDEHGWLIDTLHDLTMFEVARCVNYTIQFQTPRIARMPPGDKRDYYERALSMLRVETIKQRILARNPWDQDRIILSDRS